MKKYKQHTKEKNRKCDRCKQVKRTRNVIYHKGKFLCTNCKNKNKTTILSRQLPVFKSLKEALNKVYNIKLYCRKDGKRITAYCYFPKILAGKKFRIKLVEVYNQNV